MGVHHVQQHLGRKEQRGGKQGTKQGRKQGGSRWEIQVEMKKAYMYATKCSPGGHSGHVHVQRGAEHVHKAAPHHLKAAQQPNSSPTAAGRRPPPGCPCHAPHQSEPSAPRGCLQQQWAGRRQEVSARVASSWQRAGSVRQCCAEALAVTPTCSNNCLPATLPAYLPACLPPNSPPLSPLYLHPAHHPTQPISQPART